MSWFVCLSPGQKNITNQDTLRAMLMLSGVNRCGELEFRVRSARNPDGRSGTNRNRVFQRQAREGFLGSEITNLRSSFLEILLMR